MRSPATISTRRQQVDRVEGMGDDQAPGLAHRRLQVGRLVARGRRGHDRLGIGRLELGIDAVLELDPLGDRLDDQPGAVDRLGDRSRQPPLRPRRPGRQGQLGIGAFGVLQHRAHLAAGLRVGVIDADGDAVLDHPGQPARADDAPAQNGRAPDLHDASPGCQATPIRRGASDRQRDPARRRPVAACRANLTPARRSSSRPASRRPASRRPA